MKKIRGFFSRDGSSGWSTRTIRTQTEEFTQKQPVTTTSFVQFALDAWAQAPRGGMIQILIAIGLIEMVSNRYPPPQPPPSFLPTSPFHPLPCLFVSWCPRSFT